MENIPQEETKYPIAMVRGKVNTPDRFCDYAVANNKEEEGKLRLNNFIPSKRNDPQIMAFISKNAKK